MAIDNSTTYAQLGPNSPIKVPVPAGDSNEEVVELKKEPGKSLQQTLEEKYPMMVVDKRRSYDGAPVVFNHTPIADYLVVKRIPEEEGLIVEADVSKEKPVKCEVIAISPYASCAYASIALQAFSKGDKILIRRYAGTDIKVDGMEYTMIMVFDVMLILGETGPAGALPSR